MKRTYKYSLDEGFSAVNQPQQTFSYLIRNAEQMHWQSTDNQISEQIFDGRYAYLYYYEYWINEAMDLQVEITMNDLHLIYPQLSTGHIYGKRMDQSFTFELSEAKGAYFYLAKGIYNLHLPVGHHILIGFIVDAGMFRPPVLQQFSFIRHLIQAKKEHSAATLKSADFRVGPLTIKYLRILFSKLNPNTLNNEHILLRYLIFLVHLSRFKLIEVEDPILPLPQKAKDLLEVIVFHEGAKTRIHEIAQVLGVDTASLSRQYHQFYGISMQNERNMRLLAFVQLTIVEHDKLGATADETGFSGPSELNRFVKKLTGKTASQFKAEIEKNLKR